MNPVQMLQSILKVDRVEKTSMVALKQGQLLYGRVEKFLSHDTAIIQIGNLRLSAQVKASLLTADSHWFEVRSNGDDGIQLKVLEGKGQNLSDPSNLLVEHFQLPASKINLQLLQSLLKLNLPFTKDQLRTASLWITKQADAQELTAIELMVKKDLPFTKQTFKSLVAVQESQSLINQLSNLGSYLEDPKFASFKTIAPLKQMISTILANSSIDELGSGLEVKHTLQTIVQSLGIEYEKELNLWLKDNQNSFESLHSLKPLLMSAITELGTSGKELEPLLNRITGMQLISQDASGPMLQMLMQLPITFGDKQSEVTLQWSGRKTNTGQIDPDYCRILFYLDLERMKQTVIDMQIQNKVIHVTVINDTKEIESIVSFLTPTLKEKLESIGYQLSFIKVIPSIEQRKVDPRPLNPINLYKEFYQGVDVKI
jgi:hypothetical protein